MIQEQGDEQACHGVESQTPGVCHLARVKFQESGNGYEQSLSENSGNPVERRAYAHEKRLVVSVEPEHVEPVGCNVVRGAAECYKPKEC